MTALKWVDNTKIVQRARDKAVRARLEMFAAFAQLQLDVQSTHAKNWDSLSVRALEDKIDAFKESCQSYRSAEDGIIVAMSTDAGRVDAAVPSPADLGKTPPDTTAPWEQVLGVATVDDHAPPPGAWVNKEPAGAWVNKDSDDDSES